MQQMLKRLVIAGIAVLGAACSDGGRGDKSVPTAPPALRENGGSANGSKFVFVSGRDTPNATFAQAFTTLEIYASNGDASGATRLTNNAFSEYFPTWSPNGHEIAFESNEGYTAVNVRTLRKLYIMNDDGSDRRYLTTGTSATWSPNGQQLAFHDASLIPGDSDIFVINADGTGRTNLTNSPGYDGDADWSPNGQQILFSSRRGAGGEVSLYVMNADGSEVTRLTARAKSYESGADWSPNGQHIVFARRDSILHPRYELYTINADGSDEVRLTFNNVLDATPSWSPDGKQIAFHSTMGGELQPQLYVMNADGSDQHAVTTPPGRNQYVNWGNGHLNK